MEEVIGWAWDVFQPLLFGLIGAEIRVSELEGHTVGEINRHTHTQTAFKITHSEMAVITVKNSNITLCMKIYLHNPKKEAM